MAPFWKLVAQFGEVELPGPPQTTKICPCAYCWCGNFMIERSPVSIFRSFISAEAKESLRELLDGHGPDDRGDSVPLPPEILTKTDDRPLGKMETQDEDVSVAMSTPEEGNKTADQRINGELQETTTQSNDQQTNDSNVNMSLAVTSSFVGRRSSTSEASNGVRNLENSTQSKEFEQASALDSADISDSEEYAAQISDCDCDSSAEESSDSFQSCSSFRQTSPQQSSCEVENSISSATLKSNSQPSTTPQDPESQSKCPQSNMQDNKTTTSLEGGDEFLEAAAGNVLRSPDPPEAHQTQTQASTANSLTSRLRAGNVFPQPIETPLRSTRIREYTSSHRRASVFASVNDIDFRRRISLLLATFIMQRVWERAAKFQCDQCERAFVRKSSLVAHLDTHRNSPGNTSQLAPVNAENLPNISQTSRKRATNASMLENMDFSEVVGHKRDSFASLSGFELHRRLTLLQSTFMDLNVSAVSATSSGNVSLPQVHGNPRMLGTSGVSTTLREESSIFNSTRTRSLNMTTSAYSTPLNRMHVSHLRDYVSSPSEFNLGRRFSFLQSSILIKKAAPKFGCGHCERCFFRRGNLVIHMRKHQKILPFSCIFGNCQRRFISAAALAAHARSAHFEATNVDYSSRDLSSKTVEFSRRQPRQLAKRRTRRSTDTNCNPLLSPAANLSSTSVEVIKNGVAVVEVEKPPTNMADTSGTNEQHDLPGKYAQAQGNQTAPVASSSPPALPRQETSQPAKHLLDSDGCGETTDISVGVNLMLVLEPNTGLPSPKEIAPKGPEEYVVHGDFHPDVGPSQPVPFPKLERRKSLRISQKRNSSVHEETLESSDDGDDGGTEEDPTWTDSGSESEESEQDSDGGGIDDDSSAAAASSHELSVINESKENLPDGDETPEIKLRQPEGRQRNPKKLTRGGKPRKHKFVCRECGEQCESRAALNLHLRDHDSVRPFKCGLCATRFETRKKYLIHLKSHKDQTGLYKCNQCEYATKNAGNIIRHLGVHSGEKLHMCEDCGKAFSDQYTLKKHTRIHSGERPYKCHQCSKSFTQSWHLTVHKRVHSGERPYKCDQCKECFSHSSSLISHKQAHSGKPPHQCTECAKRFTRKSDLRRHQTTQHTKMEVKQ